MLVGLSPSFIPALWNIGILHHKKTNLRNNMRQSVHTFIILTFLIFKVWILTGDKKETAINISRSCGHWRPNMQLIDIAGKVTYIKYSIHSWKGYSQQEPLQRYLLTCQANSAFLGRFFFALGSSNSEGASRNSK